MFYSIVYSFLFTSLDIKYIFLLHMLYFFLYLRSCVRGRANLDWMEIWHRLAVCIEHGFKRKAGGLSLALNKRNYIAEKKKFCMSPVHHLRGFSDSVATPRK